jgi:hypothetical protein
MKRILVACLMLIIPFLLGAEETRDHLSLAEEAIAAGDYETALDQYFTALNENGTAIVHYKRAQLICILREKDLVCEYDAYVDGALEELSQALVMDLSLKQEIIEDTILLPLYGTVLFNIWRGGSIETDSSIALILPRIFWQTVPEGIGVTAGFMNFEFDGTVYVHWGTCYDYVEYDEATGEAIPLSRGKQEGIFTVRDGEIIIEWHKSSEYDLEGELPERSSYRLELNGVYGILRALSPGQKDLYDIPDECNI